MRRVCPVGSSRVPWLLAALLVGAPAAGQQARYDLEYGGGPTIHVEAQLPAGDGRLLIAQGGGIDHLPAQWATFVRDLRVTGPDGASVAVAAAGKEGWKLGTSEAVSLSYDVDLAYAREKWPAGNEQSGRSFPTPSAPEEAQSLYTVTRPLFLYTSGTGDASIRFDLPPRWRVATPWEAIEDGRFRASSIASLTRNSVMLGRFSAVELRVGAFDVTVATPDYATVPPLLRSVVGELGTAVARLFPGTPRGRYLMTFFRQDEEEGESFESSAALTSPVSFDGDAIVVTGNTVAHELLHHWIGGMLAPAEHDSMAWFTEGFTEYYANHFLGRSGSVEPALMRAKVKNVLTGYLYFCESPLFHGVTVATAGKKKGSYRFGVYNGGWTVALSLDVLLRSESDGRRSLDDVMYLLFERNGLSGRPIATDDLRAAAGEVAGRDLSEFFERYVLAREALPIGETLAKLGLELRGQPYAADNFLLDASAVTEEEKRLRAEIFGAL